MKANIEGVEVECSVTELVEIVKMFRSSSKITKQDVSFSDVNQKDDSTEVKRSKRYVWTDSMTNEILFLHSQGADLSQICVRYGVTIKQLQNKLYKLGLHCSTRFKHPYALNRPWTAEEEVIVRQAIMNPEIKLETVCDRIKRSPFSLLTKIKNMGFKTQGGRYTSFRRAANEESQKNKIRKVEQRQRLGFS